MLVTIPNATTTSASTATPVGQRKRCNRVPSPCCARPAGVRFGAAAEDRPASNGARRACEIDVRVRFYYLGSGRGQAQRLGADCGPRVGSPGVIGIGFAVMRRASLLIVPLVVAVGLSGAALAATHAAPRSSCTVAPKQRVDLLPARQPGREEIWRTPICATPTWRGRTSPAPSSLKPIWPRRTWRARNSLAHAWTMRTSSSRTSSEPLRPTRTSHARR